MTTRKSADEEWRALLRGGFAFETAPFAVHPTDKRLAERCFFVATRAGASTAEIVAAAEHYLRDERKVHADLIKEESDRVGAFLSRYKFSGKAKQAWLVFWNDSESCVDDVTSNLVQAFDPRMSERRICEFLEFHYRSIEYTPKELLYYSTRLKKNPCRSTPNVSKGRLKSYTCGHNPWLEARFCHDIVICDVDGEGLKVSWSNDSQADS